MEWKATNFFQKVGGYQSFSIKLLHHEHFENIMSTFNKYNVIVEVSKEAWNCPKSNNCDEKAL
jgi:hypothetical protein